MVARNFTFIAVFMGDMDDGGRLGGVVLVSECHVFQRFNFQQMVFLRSQGIFALPQVVRESHRPPASEKTATPA